MKLKTCRIKSPLRYPGGKSRAVKKILPLIPDDIQEFREPFVGGGSVFIALKQHLPDISYAINDLNYNLIAFWKTARDRNQEFRQVIESYREKFEGDSLYRHFQPRQEQNTFDRAVRFFVLNRITFSGTADSGGYSSQAHHDRFTQSSIDRISPLQTLLARVSITHDDYANTITRAGSEVFLFLDPPYFSTVGSKLYGENGDLHQTFDHERFARIMKKSPHRWLITLDDCPEVRDMFSWATILPWELQYGMDNYCQTRAGIGKELFIMNYTGPTPCSS